MEKRALSVPELAQTLGISVPSAYDLTCREGFPCIVIGTKRKIIPINALNEWLRNVGKPVKPLEWKPEPRRATEGGSM